MALAPFALTTYATVVARASTSLAQAAVEQIINEVSEGIQDHLGRQLGYHVVTEEDPEQYQGRGQLWLILDRAPILSVEAVEIDGTADTAWSRSAKYDAKGWLYRVDGWPGSLPAHYDLTRDPDHRRAAFNITVAYTAGFVLPQFDGAEDEDHNPDGLDRSLPYSIEAVAIDAVVSIATQPVGGLIEEQTVAGWRRKWASAMRPEQRRQAFGALDKFKRRWFA